MINVNKQVIDGKEGVFLIIEGDNVEIYNELRALFSKITSDDNLTKIAVNAVESLKMDMLIKNYKEKK